MRGWLAAAHFQLSTTPRCFELLTGTLPFRGKTIEEVLQAMLAQHIPWEQVDVTDEARRASRRSI